MTMQPASKSSSEEIADRIAHLNSVAVLDPVKPPAVLAKAQKKMGKKVNPLTPTLNSPLSPPRASQIAAAVIDCRPAILRSEVVPLMPPLLAAIISECGEVDLKGFPHVELFKCLIVISTINYARKVFNIEDPVLIKAEGAESAHFLHFAALAGMEINA